MNILTFQERISAHKLILSFRSPVFHSMFFGNLAGGEKEIILPDVEPIGFKKLLRYTFADLYLPKVWRTLSVSEQT